MAAQDESDSHGETGFIAALIAGQRRAVDAVATALPSIERAAAAIADKLGVGGRLIYLGAGSSGLIAMLDGAELPGTFGLDSSRIRFVLPGGVGRAYQIDGATEDDREAGRRDIEALGDIAGDIVIAVSASGSTPYTLAGARAAAARGATIVALANRPGSPLLQNAHHPILLDSGPEALQGSTRLGAGTAQKCALGLLSTLANARLGHVYRGLMVNVRPDNDKLRRRALEIVAAIADVDEPAARRSLACAADDVKCAALIAAGAGSKERADDLLARSRGHVGAALSRLREHAASRA
ncbi:MAG TPA: N-acetylmuramic acid 6-phosphate etherase [Roseiarcus sp.]|nr:N-acetylmuramic acid 6-phosphate etherase [Roseiarcus sp.]